MTVQIITSRESLEPIVDVIQKAADSERSSFGFLPPNAYREFVQQGRAVAALSSRDNTLAGYCLYGGVFPQAKIFQTYVAPSFRGQGVGQRLLATVFDRLEERGYLSAVAYVAADLADANRFYEKMGFDVVSTKKGGKTTGRLIKVRAKELSTPSLLDFIDAPDRTTLAPSMRAPRTQCAPRYVIDLNVIFDVMKKRPRSAVAYGVIAAALENDVKLAITAEILAELEKHALADKPDPILNMCRAIPTLKLPSARTLAQLRERLLPLVFPEKASATNLKPNDEADLRHLATAIEENVAGFITSDEAILRSASVIQTEFSLTVLSPSAFGQGFEVEFGAQPKAYVNTASSTLVATRYSESHRNEAELLLRAFHLSDARVRETLAGGTGTAPRRREVVLCSNGLLALATWDAARASNAERELHIYADEAKPDATLAIRHLLQRACQDIGKSPVAVFHMQPQITQHLVRKVAIANHFYSEDTSAIRNPRLRKVSLGRAVLNNAWPQVSKDIENATGVKFSGELSALNDDAMQLIDARGIRRSASLREIEEIFSPAIICAPDRLGVILPIKPRYAEELFYGAQQPHFLEHREAAMKDGKAYIGGNYGSVPEGGLAFFYESGSQGGRMAITAVARVVARYALPPDQAAAISTDRGVLPNPSWTVLAEHAGNTRS